MKKITIFIFIIGLIGLFLGYKVFVYPITWECGSSTITDLGWSFDSAERYIVNVGNVDLTQDKVSSWELCKLPESELFCGLKITLPSSPVYNAAQLLTGEVVVSIKIYDEQGKIVFRKYGNLSKDWIWSGPIDTNSAFVRGNIGFYPSENSKYRLEIEVRSAKEAKNVIATVMLQGIR
jgi:hypothetical protein